MQNMKYEVDDQQAADSAVLPSYEVLWKRGTRY